MAVLLNVDTREKMSSTTKKKLNKEKFVVAHELKLVRILAGNDKTSRNRALKSLRKWLEQRDKTMPFNENDFERIWRGLYYSLWMADKPLVQEECAENISKLIHCLTPDSSLLFFKVGLHVLNSLWQGIDQLRLDKFLMLVRRLLRQCLIFLKNNDWDVKLNKKFAQVLSETILNINGSVSVGLFMHFTEIYLEEIAKVIDENLKPGKFTEFVKPFIEKLAFSDDIRQILHVKKCIFVYLIRQTDLGIEYQEKYNAWKSQGFPGSIDSMKRIELDVDEKMSSDEENDRQSRDGIERPLDPRAGRVDVELQQIKFHPKAISNALLECRFHKNTNKRSRKTLNILAQHFQKLSRGEYPFGIKRIRGLDNDVKDMNIKKAVNRLVKFEKKLLNQNSKRKRLETEHVNNKRIKLDTNLENFEQDLEKFVEESEKDIKIDANKTKKNSNGNLNTNHTKLLKKSKKDKLELKLNSELNKFVTKPNFDLSKVEYVFERNSGTWVVFNQFSNETKKNLIPCNKKIDSFTVTQLNDANATLLNNNTGNESLKKDCTVTVSNGLDDKKEFNNSVTTEVNKKELFPKNEWDEPLQEGDIEIFIPSKKYLKLNQTVNDLQSNSFQKIKGKSRHSLDLNERNDVALSPKKVKINTKLNTSQEIHEHHAQILSSPAIPFDANKKPTKPLLKVTTSSTPVNPFYNRKLSLW